MVSKKNLPAKGKTIILEEFFKGVEPQDVLEKAKELAGANNFFEAHAGIAKALTVEQYKYAVDKLYQDFDTAMAGMMYSRDLESNWDAFIIGNFLLEKKLAVSPFAEVHFKSNGLDPIIRLGVMYDAIQVAERPLVLKHEVYHILLMHHTRWPMFCPRNEFTAKLWNYATDAVINSRYGIANAAAQIEGSLLNEIFVTLPRMAEKCGCTFSDDVAEEKVMRALVSALLKRVDQAEDNSDESFSEIFNKIREMLGGARKSPKKSQKSKDQKNGYQNGYKKGQQNASKSQDEKESYEKGMKDGREDGKQDASKSADYKKGNADGHKERQSASSGSGASSPQQNSQPNSQPGSQGTPQAGNGVSGGEASKSDRIDSDYQEGKNQGQNRSDSTKGQQGNSPSEYGNGYQDGYDQPQNQDYQDGHDQGYQDGLNGQQPKPGMGDSSGGAMDAFDRMLAEMFGQCIPLDKLQEAIEADGAIPGDLKSYIETQVKYMAEVAEKSIGTVPGNYASLVDLLRKPPLIPWKKLIKRGIQATVKLFKSINWVKLSRRHDLGFDTKRDVGAKILYMVDTSGSMDEGVLLNLFSEIKHGFKVGELLLVQYDHGLQDIARCKRTMKKINIKGRGGTSFDQCIKDLRAKNFPLDKFDAVFVCSDCYDNTNLKRSPFGRAKVCLVKTADGDMKFHFGRTIDISKQLKELEEYKKRNS